MAAAMSVFAVVFVFRVRLCVLALLAVFAVTMFAMAVFTVTMFAMSVFAMSVLTVTMFAMAALAVTMFAMSVLAVTVFTVTMLAVTMFTVTVFAMTMFTVTVLTVLAVGIARRDHAGAGVFLSATAVQVVHGAMSAAAGAILYFCHTRFLPSYFIRYRNIISVWPRRFQGTLSFILRKAGLPIAALFFHFIAASTCRTR